MSTVLNPYGMRPSYNAGIGTVEATAYANGIASGYGTALLKYQPVALNSSGQIIAATAGTNDFLGVFAGVKYILADGTMKETNQWIAGTTYSSTPGQVTDTYGIQVFVWDNPGIIYQIQADGSVAQANGGQANLSNITNGSTTTGLSQCTMSATVTTSGQGQLRIVGISLPPTVNGGTNAWGDAYTEVLVQNARHQYIANKVAV